MKGKVHISLFFCGGRESFFAPDQNYSCGSTTSNWPDRENTYFIEGRLGIFFKNTRFWRGPFCTWSSYEHHTVQIAERTRTTRSCWFSCISAKRPNRRIRSWRRLARGAFLHLLEQGSESTFVDIRYVLRRSFRPLHGEGGHF